MQKNPTSSENMALRHFYIRIGVKNRCLIHHFQQYFRCWSTDLWTRQAVCDTFSHKKIYKIQCVKQKVSWWWTSTWKNNSKNGHFSSEKHISGLINNIFNKQCGQNQHAGLWNFLGLFHCRDVITCNLELPINCKALHVKETDIFIHCLVGEYDKQKV